MSKEKNERKFPRKITKVEGDLPDSIEAIEELLGISKKALKKIDVHELLEIFTAYNEEEKSIYNVESVITSIFINQVHVDEDIAKAVGNMMEEIRSHQK